jgi:hypothetical protein
MLGSRNIWGEQSRGILYIYTKYTIKWAIIKILKNSYFESSTKASHFGRPKRTEMHVNKQGVKLVEGLGSFGKKKQYQGRLERQGRWDE